MNTKYHAKRTYSSLCNRTFSSRAECVRGEELALLEMAGEITGLEYQVPFTLSIEPKVTITIDFTYKPRIYSDLILQKAGNNSGKILLYDKAIYEDVKGYKETREFRVKRIWLKEKYGIDVELIR